MSIIIKNTRVMVSVTVIAAVFASFALVSSTQAQSVAQLQAQLAQLTAQLSALEGVSTTTTRTTVVRSNGNAACPNTWTRNLTIGSTGDDVLQLQRFLNGDSRTQVASSGAGSAGNESRYYGPITASAVSKFQELYAAQILTPIGLTRGTGGFYTSTRRQANSLCATASAGANINVGSGVVGVSPVGVSPIIVSGDSLGISAGPTIGDGYAIQGAQRLPFTSFVLTAGNDNVRINGIRVRRFGLSNRDQVADVAVVDQDGIQYGSSRSLSSRDEATVGTGISLRAGESKTFAVVGNIINEDDTIESGATVGFEIYDVTSNSNVVGVGNGLVIRGATHVVSSALTLQKVEVNVKNSGGDIELNSDEEVVTVEVEVNSGGNREDGYLKTLILEQDGSADESDLGDITVLVDDEEVRGSNIVVEGDRYIITFSGNGQLIEEGDSIDVSLQINTNEGSGEQVQFVIDEIADVHVIGAKNGYGLPVTLTNNGKDDAVAEIGTGDIRNSRIRGFEDEISYGDDKIVGSLGVEFEGEDVRLEDLTFKVEITGLGKHAVPTELDDSTPGDLTDTRPIPGASESFADSNNEVETLTLDNIRLFVDGEEVSSADDVVEIDASESTTGNPALTVSGAFTQTDIEFDGSFEVDVRGSSDVRFDIVADLDSDWSYFDNPRITFTLTNVDEAEGLVSEDDYTVAGKFFGADRDFEDVQVQGNEVSFDLNTDNVDDSEFVAGSDSVIFATLEIDADDSSDDVEIKNVYLALTGTKATSGRETGSGVSAKTELDVISGCELINDGDRVGSQRGSFSKETESTIAEVVRFRVSNFEVRAGNTEQIDVVCDIDSDAVAGDSYQFSLFGTPTGTKIEYRIAGDDIDETGSEATEEGESIRISESGSLDVSFEAPDEDLTALSVGSNGLRNQALTTIIFEAEEEDFEIKDVYLTGLKLVGDEDMESFDKIISNIEIALGNTGGSDFDDSEVIQRTGITGTTTYTDLIKFDGVNEIVRKDQEVEFDLNVDYRGITKRNGASGQTLDISSSKLVVVYEGQESDKEVTKEFSISSSVKNRVFPTVLTVTESSDPGGTLTNAKRALYQFTVRASDDNAYLKQVGLRIDVTSGVTLTDIELRKGSTTIGTGADIASGTGGIQQIAFTETERIDAGQSKTYTLHARVAGSADDKSILVELAVDDTPPTVLGAAYAASLGNFVWSPNGLNQDGITTSTNTDWFNGYALFDDSDIEGWLTDK